MRNLLTTGDLPPPTSGVNALARVSAQHLNVDRYRRSRSRLAERGVFISAGGRQPKGVIYERPTSSNEIPRAAWDSRRWLSFDAGDIATPSLPRVANRVKTWPTETDRNASGADVAEIA
jgi:hypothetical protein